MTRSGRIAVAGAMLTFTGGLEAAPGKTRWIATWAAAPMPADAGSAMPVEMIRDATVRQFIRVSAGGISLRVRLTNRFGTAPMRVDGVRVALGDDKQSGAIIVRSDHAVTFGGASHVVVPAGADYVSDAVNFPLRPLTTLAITMHFPEAPARRTVHYVSKSTSYVVRGAVTAAPSLSGATTFEHWYQLSGVDVDSAGAGQAVAVLGDSITDGHASGADRNERWTDILANRLNHDPTLRHVSVLNLGVSGNRLLKEGSGPSGMARFGYDILDQPGISTVIVLEGTNDIGKLSREGLVTPAGRADVVANVIGAYRQIVEQAHMRGIRVVGATLPPFGGTQIFRSDAEAMADREAINAWIRAPQHFDAFIDFDMVMRDPARPDRLVGAYDSGDHIHPSSAGYRVMGESVPLAVLTP